MPVKAIPAAPPSMLSVVRCLCGIALKFLASADRLKPVLRSARFREKGAQRRAGFSPPALADN